MTAINNGKIIYASIYGSNIAPLTYIADNNSFIEFNAIKSESNEGQYTAIWMDSLTINNDDSFFIKHTNLLNSTIISEDEIDNLSSLLI
jgi:hypothetical protein